MEDTHVDDVKVFSAQGPWKTKSNAVLMKLFELSFSEAQNFFSYDKEEIERLPKDIRGFRSYTVRGIPKGTTGANEFHRLRRELLYVLEGKVKIVIEDLQGEKRDFVLTPTEGILCKPFIHHRYEALEEESGLIVITNTIFNVDDSTTHDTYGHDEFRRLQG
jgi:quercetin dioxygenase-like cupin family protein